jgi:transposase
MARPYSNDLRCRILKAYERGGVSQRELAERYQVSLPYVKKIRRQQLRTGRMERPPERRPGPARRITPTIAAQLREWVRGSPDLTLAELQQKMAQSCRVHTSLKPIWWVLQEMGLRLKKNRSTPRSKRRPQPGSGGRHGGSRSRR